MKTSLEQGLTSNQVESFREQYGLNQLTPPETVPWYIQFFHHLTGFFSLLLWLASFLCFIAYALEGQSDNLSLGIVLAAVVIITGVFSYYQDGAYTH